MSEADRVVDLIGRVYEVEDLITMLYPNPPEIDLDFLWTRFHTSPRMNIFRSEGVKQALISGNCSNVFRRYRLSFFPDLEDNAIEKEIFFAMNMG